MLKTIELIIGILTGVLLIGIMVLIGLSKDISVLMPIVTVLIGYLVGRNQETVVNYFKSKLTEK